MIISDVRLAELLQSWDNVSLEYINLAASAEWESDSKSLRASGLAIRQCWVALRALTPPSEPPRSHSRSPLRVTLSPVLV